MCYAVSVTSDPLGEYYRYEFLRPLFPDYPRPAVWPDGYYVPTSTSDDFIQKHTCAVDRARMLFDGSLAGFAARESQPGHRHIYIESSEHRSPQRRASALGKLSYNPSRSEPRVQRKPKREVVSSETAPETRGLGRRAGLAGDERRMHDR